MAFKMKGFPMQSVSTLKNKIKEDKFDVDKIIDKENYEILKKSNNLLIKEQEELYKKGKISKAKLNAAKEEIKNYTDIDVAKEHLEKLKK